MIRVFSAPILAQAHIIRGALEAAGIHAVVRGEERTPLAGGLPVDQCFAEVWVPEDRAAEAQQVVTDLEPGRGAGTLSFADGPRGGELSPAGEWACATCGEKSPAHFGTCWACQRDR